MFNCDSIHWDIPSPNASLVITYARASIHAMPENSQSTYQKNSKGGRESRLGIRSGDLSGELILPALTVLSIRLVHES